MKVILQQNVLKLGKAGDIVEASAGYYRNYLAPRKLAVVATDGSLKKREEDLAALRKKAEAAHQEAVALSEKITAIGSIRLTAKVGEGGKLYGKITNKEIGEALKKELGGVELDKRTIKLLDDMSSLGTFRAQVKLAPEVQSDITVEVAPEGSLPKSAEAKAAPPAEPAEEEAVEV